MALKTNRPTMMILALALACTLGLVGFVLAPAPQAEASGCSGPIECFPGEPGLRNTGHCCCEGRKLQQSSTCTSNCTWGPWTDAGCGGPSCNPSGPCA